MDTQNRVENLVIAYITKTDKKNLDIFWLGFIIYSLALIVSTTETVNVILCNAFQAVGIVLFLFASVKLLKGRFEDSFLKYSFNVLCLWFLVVVVRGLSFDYNSIKRILFEPYNVIFIYLTPLIILFPRDLYYYKRMFDVITLFSLLYIVISVVFSSLLIDRDNLIGKYLVDYFARNFGLTGIFLLLTYPYHSGKRKLLALATTLLTLLFAIYRARRGLTFMVLLPIAFCYLIYAYQVKSTANIVISLIVIVFTGIFLTVQFNSSDSALFSLFKERVSEESRGSVEDCYYDDMKTSDWILGRGMNGTYYCPSFNDENDASGTQYRDLIETDFLTIILKGGIISLGLLLLITVPAIINGLFYSRNLLSKGAAIWILMWVIGLYPSTEVTFNLNYLIVWVLVGLCYSRTIRYIPEDIMISYFNKGKYILKPVS